MKCNDNYSYIICCQGSLSRSGSWTRSPQRGLDSGESSPHGSSSRCSTSNMTTASTQKTEAMPTKDALFGRKKKDVRVFPDFTAGSETVLPRGINKNGYSVFDEVLHRILHAVTRILSRHLWNINIYSHPHSHSHTHTHSHGNFPPDSCYHSYSFWQSYCQLNSTLIRTLL